MSGLGEIFYNNRLISLRGNNEEKLQKILDELEKSQAYQKDNIDNCLNEMRKE